MSTHVARTIPEALDQSVREHSRMPALAYVDGTSYCYQDVHDLSRRTAVGLRELGVRQGTHVAILGENMPNWGVAYLAVTGMGAVAVPLLPDFSADEVRNILRHAETRFAFVSDRQYPKVEELERTGEVHVIRLNSLELPDAPHEGPQSDATAQDGDEHVDPTAPAAIIYTSGTTGNSKGVILTHRNIVSNVEAARRIPDIRAGQSMISLLPLSHAYECTLGFLVPLVSGACVYYLDKPPSPSVLMPALQKVRPHLMLSVPLFIEKIFRGRVLPQFTEKPVVRFLYRIRPIQRLLHKLAGRKVYKLFGGRLHFFGIGGAPLAPDAERFLRDARFPYAVGYGLTETAPLIAGSSPRNTRFQAIGPVLSGVEVRLDTGNAPSGEGEVGQGEVQVRGPNVTPGYFKDSARSHEAFTEDGWFRTGDVGHLTRKGVLSIRGRIKNVILGPSGENIYPEEIEALLNEKPYVEETLVAQVGGKLVAMAYFNYEALLEHLSTAHSSLKEWHAAAQANMDNSAEQVRNYLSQFRDEFSAYFAELKAHVNAQLSGSVRIAEIQPREEPFEKTPTMKIKRYLYA